MRTFEKHVELAVGVEILGEDCLQLVQLVVSQVRHEVLYLLPQTYIKRKVAWHDCLPGLTERWGQMK
jgi:hypothetical protein